MTFPDFSGFGPFVSQEQLEIREIMMRFGRERLAPGAAERDWTHAFPAELIDELGALGGMGIKVPEVQGGPGLDNVSYALSIEALARYDGSVAVSAVASNLACNILAHFATADQNERFVAPAATGQLGALAFALTEPGAGSDAAGIKTTARPDAGDWVIDGSKQWITSGSNAKLFTVFAKTPTDSQPNAIAARW